MRLPQWNLGNPANIGTLVTAIQRSAKDIVTQINLLSDGRVSAVNTAASAAPAAGSTLSYVQGDFVRNSVPVEMGSSGAKYVITGWLCVASGTPGTFVQCRALTGN